MYIASLNSHESIQCTCFVAHAGIICIGQLEQYLQPPQEVVQLPRLYNQPCEYCLQSCRGCIRTLLPRLQACNKSHTAPSVLYYFYYTVGKGSSWYKTHNYSMRNPRVLCNKLYSQLALMLVPVYFIKHSVSCYIYDYTCSTLYIYALSNFW